MFLTGISQSQNKLSYLFIVILLCLGYYDHVFITEPIAIFFQLSSYIGQILVNKLITVYNCSCEAVKLIFSFFQILYEDSLIFFKDATEKFTFALHLLKELYLFLETAGWNLLRTLLLFLENVFGLLQFMQETIVAVKHGIHHIGSTIWHFFVYLPQTVLNIIYGIYSFISNTFIEIITFIAKVQNSAIEKSKNFYLFLFDVPLDSIYGLAIGSVLLLIFCVKFLDICYFLIRITKKLHHIVTSFLTNLWSGRFLERRRHVEAEEDDDDADERLCIICQYQYKEIIIFPCKHLCLCRDCSKELVRNQPRCPICRGNITGILKVYL